MNALVKYRFKGETKYHEVVIDVKPDRTYSFTNPLQQVISHLSTDFHGWETENIEEFYVNFVTKGE